ncbi:ATP-binding protein [Consotaella salsifontis]|uniref:histidine kinase n=1 Tax=Consotaella salsifontis TaxID=1365950 RepID=A0A1T4M7W4_9HYPH|nr:ATP-binding protein [Consotaella salsifontis]SJZ62995.1 Two-component sensor histidine kinase, contains HisKA and HATPase domains [Consotaella salsifontis]
MRLVVTSIRIERDTDVAHTRRTARVAAKASGCSTRDQIRFATAVSEIARNALQYADGGIAEFSFDRTGGTTQLIAKISDNGGGIPEQVISGGGRSHIRSSTGLGLGLAGSRKLVDGFDIVSGSGGTVATLKMNLEGGPEPAALSHAAADAMIEAAKSNPLDELAEQNRALRDSLAQQEFLLRELHHRTKNNLAVIQSLAIMQGRQMQSEEARTAFETLTSRIRAFANAHNFLHRADDVSSIDLKLHIAELAHQLGEAFGAGGIVIDCELESVSVDFDTATEVGLIVNELVTNAAKHAFTGRHGTGHILIEVYAQDARFILKVSDNGPGLADAEATLRDSRSLGWRIVQGGARKLNADLKVDGKGGLSVTLVVPNE